MSYVVKFKGKFAYESGGDLLSALAAIAEEENSPDDFERNVLEKGHFSTDKTARELSIAYSGSMPASCYYGCTRLLRKMSKHAVSGKIRCSFEGDRDEWIKPGTV